MATQSSLTFGVATRDITPAYPVCLHGYGDRNRKSDGVLDPIAMSCLAVSNGATTLLLVTADMIGIESWRCEELAALVEREVGIDHRNVLIACSHTHFAPSLQWEPGTSPQANGQEPDPRFIEAFRKALVDAARESLRGLQPGRLQSLRLRAPQVLFNRRTVRKADGSVTTNFLYPEDPDQWNFPPVDDQLTVLRVLSETGVRAMLVNFGCHPVTGGAHPERDDAYRISADYPQYLRQTVAEKYACPVLFTLGAAGDAVPMLRRDECRQRIGRILGDTIVLGERACRCDNGGLLRADAIVVECETAMRTDVLAVEGEYAAARAEALRIAEAPDAGQDSAANRSARLRLVRAGCARHRARIYPAPLQAVRVQFMQIGATTLVAWPFEVLSAIGLQIKQRFPNAVLVSCAGGYQGYMPLATDHPRGGYEVSAEAVHFVAGTGDRLLEATLRWLEQNGADSKAVL